jgi:hypothetical protein
VLTASIGAEAERRQVVAPRNLRGVPGLAATKNCGAFRDMPYARTGETPYIQRCHFGAVIASVHCNMFGTNSKAEWET